MYDKVLPGGTATTLRKIAENGLLAQAYLAGGTAVALHLGHRISRDLDFFTPERFQEDRVIADLEELGLVTEERHEQTVLGMIEGVHFSYFLLPYPLIEEPSLYQGIRIAGLQDCAVMKFEAIGRRGAQRDFIDLFTILQDRKITLFALLDLHKKKYGDRHNTRMHNFHSLTYFAEAEAAQDRPLELLQPIDWEEVKAFFRREVEKTARELLRG